MDVEITKSDLKTIVSKASRDNKFNAIKLVNFKKKLRFNGLACRTKRGSHPK